VAALRRSLERTPEVLAAVQRAVEERARAAREGEMLAGAAPAAAQDAQETPWYMPQPWMHPQATGPSVRFPPGYYGNSYGYNARPYGSFGTGCYGNCRMVRGTVATSSGVVLFRPTVVAFDQRGYQIVPRSYLQPRYVVVRASAPRQFAAPKPMAVAARKPAKPLPQFSVQNGVRIIRPLPMVAT
jgi:hypothetical protein